MSKTEAEEKAASMNVPGAVMEAVFEMSEKLSTVADQLQMIRYQIKDATLEQQLHRRELRTVARALVALALCTVEQADETNHAANRIVCQLLAEDSDRAKPE